VIEGSTDRRERYQSAALTSKFALSWTADISASNRGRGRNSNSLFTGVSRCWGSRRRQRHDCNYKQQESIMAPPSKSNQRSEQGPATGRAGRVCKCELRAHDLWVTSAAFNRVEIGVARNRCGWRSAQFRMGRVRDGSGASEPILSPFALSSRLILEANVRVRVPYNIRSRVTFAVHAVRNEKVFNHGRHLSTLFRAGSGTPGKAARLQNW
jgi:hypothetical protein